MSDTPDAVVAVTIGRDHFASEIVARGHALLADEPVALGGRDAGPTPYDLLLSALGSCTAITLRIYADRKGWNLDRVAVTLRHGRIHASDCQDCETRAGKIDTIERDILLEGDLDDEQRARLLEIAEKCPIHRTLTSEVRIATRLVTAASAPS